MSARFCTHCGAPLVRQSVAGDAHQRLACSACARISYENPAIRVACIATMRAARSVLCCTQLAHFERIQAAALRALGAAGSALREEQLALYCTLSDLDSGSVVLVFRARAPLPVDANFDEAMPAWGVALLECHALDRDKGCFPVRAGVHAGGTLCLDEVVQDSAGAP